MTTETATTHPSSIEERMARIEAQQEIIIDLLKAHNARFDRIDEKFDEVHRRIDTTNHRIFLAGLGLFTIVGAGVATYIVNLIV